MTDYRVKVGSNWATPRDAYAYTGNKWVKVTPYVYTGGRWIKYVIDSGAPLPPARDPVNHTLADYGTGAYGDPYVFEIVQGDTFNFSIRKGVTGANVQFRFYDEKGTDYSETGFGGIMPSIEYVTQQGMGNYVYNFHLDGVVETLSEIPTGVMYFVYDVDVGGGRQEVENSKIYFMFDILKSPVTPDPEPEPEPALGVTHVAPYCGDGASFETAWVFPGVVSNNLVRDAIDFSFSIPKKSTADRTCILALDGLDGSSDLYLTAPGGTVTSRTGIRVDATVVNTAPPHKWDVSLSGSIVAYTGNDYYTCFIIREYNLNPAKGYLARFVKILKEETPAARDYKVYTSLPATSPTSENTFTFSVKTTSTYNVGDRFSIIENLTKYNYRSTAAVYGLTDGDTSDTYVTSPTVSVPRGLYVEVDETKMTLKISGIAECDTSRVYRYLIRGDGDDIVVNLVFTPSGHIL